MLSARRCPYVNLLANPLFQMILESRRHIYVYKSLSIVKPERQA
jgi:hypothetical protein